MRWPGRPSCFAAVRHTQRTGCRGDVTLHLLLEFQGAMRMATPPPAMQLTSPYRRRPPPNKRDSNSSCKDFPLKIPVNSVFHCDSLLRRLLLSPSAPSLPPPVSVCFLLSLSLSFCCNDSVLTRYLFRTVCPSPFPIDEGGRRRMALFHNAASPQHVGGKKGKEKRRGCKRCVKRGRKGAFLKLLTREGSSPSHKKINTHTQ